MPDQPIGDFDQAIQVLKLRGVPDVFVDLILLFRDETLLNSPAKAAAVKRVAQHATRELASAGIV